MAQLAASMREWGWTNPVLVDEGGTIIAGHGRVLAARELGLAEVPVVVAEGWTEAQKRAYVIADNQLSLNAGWDLQGLAGEVQGLAEWGFDVSLLGFDDLDALLAKKTEGLTDPDDTPDPPADPVTRPGDLWICGRHRVVCGNATEKVDWTVALDGCLRPALVLTDPPYGVGLDYETFDDSREGVAAIAAQWLPLARSISPVVAFSSGVTRQWIYPEPDWVMCWFYGSGQFRSPWGFNCWQPILCYGKDPSLASGHGCRPDAFDLNTPANVDLDHPCPKPMALWNALVERLVFKPNSVICDCFAGSGTTLIACEMSGHTAAAIELSPAYCDVIVERWQDFTGGKAKRA